MAPIKMVVKENKLLSTVVAIMLGLLMSWGIWVTTGTFDIVRVERKIDGMWKAKEILNDVKYRELCKDIDEIQKIQLEARKDRENMLKLIHQNHEEILKLLMRINKKIE